jgi:vacuolar-type H+-ATPase subunit I/STV1
MFVKSDIRKITIAVEKAFYSEIYLELGKAGIIHLARFDQRDAAADTGLQEEEALARDVVAGTQYVLNALMMVPEDAGSSVPPADKKQDLDFVLHTRRMVERAVRLRARIREKEDMVSRQIRYAEVLGKMGIEPDVLKKARFVKIIFGTVENIVGDVPSDSRFMLKSIDNYVLGVVPAPDYPALLQFLKDYGFADKSDEIGSVPREKLQGRRQTLERRSEIIDTYLNRMKDEKGKMLKELNSSYRGYEEMLKAIRMSLFSAKAMFITGWMDIKEREKLLKILEKICGNRFIFSERKDPDAPVRLLNIKLFKPFELIVKTMGMPSNSEIDPTPLTAITFVIMFGLMFGDVGQGIVLALCGIMLKKFGHRKLKENLEQAGGILIACGISAAVCGLLYGSVFSGEHLLSALWFHPTAHIMKLFASTILIGIVFIMTGLAVNIINNILNTDYTEALLEKRGLVILIVYAAIVFFAFNYQTNGRFPAVWEIGAFVILPLMLFSLRGLIGHLFFQKAKPHSIPEYIVETVMEIVEIALSLFANTISFIRVGAFALSHAGLSIVIYTLAGIADPGLHSAGAIIIIIIGNIFIIGFEGLICGIQSMRLEYYEFFSKFFKGEGVVFSPFTLKAKASEV